MYCTACGKQIIDTARFCNYCGNPVVGMKIPEPNNSPVSVGDSSPVLTEENPSVSMGENLSASMSGNSSVSMGENPSVSADENSRISAAESGVLTENKENIFNEVSVLGNSQSYGDKLPNEEQITETGSVDPQADNSQTFTGNETPTAAESPYSLPAPGLISVSGESGIQISEASAKPAKPLPERKYTFGHIMMCLAAVAVMAIVAGVFAGLYFSVV